MNRARFPISVVVIARNEADGIVRCLRSLSWCDDVVVIDDNSTDRTVELAQSCGARVIQHRFESFAAQRNWAIAKAGLKHEWVLMLDADEVIPLELQNEIESTLPNVESDVVGFKMCRKTMFMGHWLKYSDGFPVWIARLVRAGHFQFQDSGHGEVPVPEMNGRLLTLPTPFLHFPFDKGLGHWIERHNRYAEREAERELREVNHSAWSGLWNSDRSRRRQSLRTVSRHLPCRATLRFLYQYILKRGFMDGHAGLTFSWLMSVYEGLIVVKRRELEWSRRAGLQ
jgi:glycosyltransferase involved in cell wall biosynthesis